MYICRTTPTHILHSTAYYNDSYLHLLLVCHRLPLIVAVREPGLGGHTLHEESGEVQGVPERRNEGGINLFVSKEQQKREGVPESVF